MVGIPLKSIIEWLVQIYHKGYVENSDLWGVQRPAT